MNRVELMELVRNYQVGGVTRRQFLVRATAVLGSAIAANSLLAACNATPNEDPPPVVDENQPPATVGSSSDGELISGIVSYPGLEDDALMGYWAYREGGAARPAIIVIQEWWGLNEHIKDVARRFAAEGYVALAPDLYHGVVTTEPDEARKQAMELGMRDAVGEIQAAIDYLKGQDVVNGRFGIVGFCMGGGLVLQTAVVRRRQLNAQPALQRRLRQNHLHQIHLIQRRFQIKGHIATERLLEFLRRLGRVVNSGQRLMHQKLNLRRTEVGHWRFQAGIHISHIKLFAKAGRGIVDLAAIQLQIGIGRWLVNVRCQFAQHRV